MQVCAPKRERERNRIFECGKKEKGRKRECMCVRNTERGGEGDQEHLNMERRREAEKVSACVCIKERERESTRSI